MKEIIRNIAFGRMPPKGPGLTVALLVHAIVLLVLVLGSRRSPPELAPISVTIIGQPESLDSRLLVPQSEAASRFIRSEGNPGLSTFKLGGQQLVSRLTPASDKASHLREVDDLHKALTRVPTARNPKNPPDDHEIAVQSGLISPTRRTTPRDITDLIEQQHPEMPSVTTTEHTGWQDSPVEDKELKYSAPGGAVQLTVREASSAGLLGTISAPDFNLTKDETWETFDLASTEWSTNTTAKSQKVALNLVDSGNIRATVFGYQNEVGSDFQPFGRTRKEFGTAGTRTTKAGGQVRVGAISFGFAYSHITNIVDTNANFFTTPNSSAAAAQRDASITLALPQLFPGVQESVSNLLPTLWASISDKRSLLTGSESSATATKTISTSFGGTWNWNNINATIGYWSYASGKNPSLGTTWGGRGFDANLGTYRSSFGIDAGVSYGQSEDTTLSSQSAGALYDAYVTISYAPKKLPAMWVTAVAGNYDHNAIAYSVTSSNIYANQYADYSHGAYSSFTVGLELANWLWSNKNLRNFAGPYPSVKLLYRYTENTFLDNSAQPIKNTSNLAAMMIQGRF